MLGDFCLMLMQCLAPKSLLPAHVGRFLVNFRGMFGVKIAVAGAYLAIFWQFWGIIWLQNCCCRRIISDFLLIWGQFFAQKSMLQAHVGRFFCFFFGAIFCLKPAAANACLAIFCKFLGIFLAITSLLQAHVWRLLVNFGAIFGFKIAVASAC